MPILTFGLGKTYLEAAPGDTISVWFSHAFTDVDSIMLEGISAKIIMGDANKGAFSYDGVGQFDIRMSIVAFGKKLTSNKVTIKFID